MKNDDIIGKVCMFIQDHFAEIQTAEEIAMAIGMNYNTLRISFVREIGMSLNNYLMRIRCEQIKNLLSEGEMKLLQIAFEVGLHDEKYLSRMFKKCTGMSPDEYKQKYMHAS